MSVNPVNPTNEPVTERSYDRVRIFHRYRVRGLHERLKSGMVKATQQATMRFTPIEEQVAVIESLWDDEQPKEIWVQRFQKLLNEESSEVESSIRVASPQHYQGFTEYFAVHEERTKGEFHVLNATVKNPIQVFKFGVYSAAVGDPNVFLVTAPKDVADGFLKRFIANGVITTYTPIDLQKLVNSETTKVRGGGFRIKGRTTLTTATIYGPEVNHNEMWADLSTDGTLQFVQLQIVTQDRELTLRVSNRGSLMPFGVDEMHEQLGLVTEVYDKYLKQFEKPEVILR